ncbi:TEX15 [Branchiostoma lanceolatum]|uniref:TEX15 protein n=1 Tax=Branchiostoma lanceolatum TaxID=7740 RepID=A0A8K0ED62_BRALA|nr:TEX15 [Branchiostoma lanceolatum]
MKSATTAQETLKQIYANRNLSSVYSIPRKQAGPGCCLQDVKVHGREWREISKIVQQSVMDRSTMARWQIDRIQLCRNPTLEERFIKKRQKMKEDGRSAKELTEQHAFHVVSHAKAKHVCQSGLVVCSGQTAFTNFLGRSDMGVYVRRNADIALKLAEKCSYPQTALMVFKIIPGRIKPIPTSFKTIEDAIEPTPNFDSHLSNRSPTSIQKEAHQLANSCIYLYEYDDSCRPSKAPSQILPYAVVSCTKISPPKVLVASPIVSVTDVSSSDTDGLGSDMDIDDSGDEIECDVKTAESSGTSLSIETVKETQASERNKKLSVGDIQDCNLGPSRQTETSVFLKPTPLLFGNKISQTVKQKTDPTTSQGVGRSTLPKPAKFLYGNKESQTKGALNTLELGVQKLQATSDCPQLVVAVRTAATVAIRTSTTLLELAVQEVRDHISRKMDQMQGGTFQQPPLDCRKLESLISGTMNTLKMMSDDMGDSSLQSSFQTALTLLELAVDIVWVRGQPRGSTVVQPQLHPQTQGDNRATEAYHPIEGQSNVFKCGQWEESCGQAQTSQWHTNEEREEQVTVDHEAFSMEEGHGSGHRQLTTTSTKESAKPVTPPPLPPPLPTFLSLTPQQLFTIARRQVDSPSIPSPDAAELGADYNGNLVGTSWKCRDSEAEGALDRNKQTTRSWQANKLCTEMQTTSKVCGSCEDEEMTPNLSVDKQNMMADHDVKSHLEADLEAGYRYEKIHLWTEEYARKIERFEESTPRTCDEPKPMETSGIKQESGMTGKEEMSTLKPKATFPSGDTRAGSEFAVSKENDGMRPLCCHPKKSTLKEEQDSSLDHQQVCVKPSGSAENHSSTSSEQKGNREEESSYAELTNEKEETNVLGTQKNEETKEEESHDYENQKDKRAGNDSSTNSANLPSQSCSPQESVLSHLADDNIERLADVEPMLSDDDDHDLYSISNDSSLSSSLLSTSVGGQSFRSSSANESFLCGKEKDVENTTSEGIFRPFSCFAPQSKGEPTDKESRCTFSAKLAATANIDPTLGNKLAMAAELPTKLSCPKMLINEHCTKSSVREETAQEGGRQKEKEAYERARKRWTRLFKSLVHQGDNNKADREVKAEEQQKFTDSFSATVHGSEVETKAELEQNTSRHTGAGDSHKACNSSVLFKAKGGSQLSEAPFDFDMVLSCARSSHAQEMFQCIADRMKKVSAEIDHFQQGIVHLKLEKNSFNGLYLQKDQHALLLRSAIIHLSEISTELEMLHATKTYLSNIQRKEVGQKEKKTPLQDVDTIMPEEDFATPEERKPDTIRNILLRQRDMKRGQVKALHKSLKSYQLINGNNVEFVKMLLKSQIQTCGNDILRLEEVLKEKKPSLKISPNQVKISEVRERQTKCQDLLRTLVKDTSPDHAKIEWCKMKCGKYHSILLYEGDKCYLREHRSRSKSRSSVVDDKTKSLVSRENSTAETQDASSSKTMKRQYDAVGKQPQGKNDQSSKRRKTGAIIQQRLAHEVTSARGHVNPTADDATVETSAVRLGTSSQEQPREKEKPDRLEKTRPKLALTGNDCETWKPAVTSPCDLRQQQLDVTIKSSKSLVVTIFNPAAKGHAEDVSGRSSKASQDIFGESKGTKESDVTKKEAVPVASAVSSSISTDQDPSAQEQTTFPGIEVKGTWAKCPLDSGGAVKVKTADAKPIQTQLKNRTFYSPSRQAAVPGMHRTSSTANKQPLSPGPNMYTAVPYRYPLQNTPPRQVQYPTSHLRPRMNWWSQAPNFIHRPMFPPQSMFRFPNQQMFPNRWPTN